MGSITGARGVYAFVSGSQADYLALTRARRSLTDFGSLFRYALRMIRNLLISALAFLLFSLPVLAKDPKDKLQPVGPVALDKDGEKWAEKTLKKLSLEEKIGQMIMIWSRAGFYNVGNPEYIKLRDNIRKYHIGALAMTVQLDGNFLIKSDPYEVAAMTNGLQQGSELPIIFAADYERGLGMRINGVTNFPHPMAFGAAGTRDFSFAFGQITAQEARAVGIHWNFFPTADVNSNPLNPIINTRSFGEDPKQVGELVAAYIVGAKSQGMLTTAKHFPGHGDTDIDTHLSMGLVTGNRARLDSVEFAPFRDAIRAGVDSVMIAHVSAPAIDPDPNRVASVSPAVVELLKRDLGFNGVVVTDALDMNGLLKLFPPERGNPSGMAAVDAVKAGNDMVIIPADLDGTYSGLLNAVKNGEIPEARIDEAVLKLLRLKASVGLNKGRLVDLNALPRAVATPENVGMAQKISDAALTLVKDNGRILPIRTPQANGTSGSHLTYKPEEEIRNRVVAVIFVDDVRLDSGRVLERQLRSRIRDANIFYVDTRFAAGMKPLILEAVRQAQVVIAAAAVIPSAGRTAKGQNAKGSVSLTGELSAVMNGILHTAADRTVVIALGNPYLAAEYPQIQNYICAYSNAPVSEMSAIKALFGEMPIRGHLPVTIPSIAQRGQGLERFAQPPTGGTISNGKR